MKGLPKLALVLLFAFYFCAGFMVGFNLMGLYIEEKNTFAVKNIIPAGFNILVFIHDDVKIVPFEKLEGVTSLNPDYSFIVPKGLENFYSKKLRSANEGVIFEIEVEQIDEKRQLISFSSDDTRSLERNTYEATEKEVFPKTSMWLNWRHTPLKLFVSTLCGALTWLIFFVIYQKLLVR